jgi:hypothetical protein
MKTVERILIGLVIIGFLVTCGMSIKKASAHENDCWYHLPESGTGPIYGSEYCDIGIQKIFRDPDEKTWQYLLWSSDHWHVFSPSGNCEVRAEQLGCRSDQDDTRD